VIGNNFIKIILKAQNYKEVKNISNTESFVADGYVTNKLSILQVAIRDNGYLL
jgi:hypothetical protein